MTPDERATTAARRLIVDAVQAARYDLPIDQGLETAITEGEDVPFERLNFDSLGWMEFCISVEVNGGLELTPAQIGGMRSLSDVERWLTERAPA